MPNISVVLPVHNGATYLKQSISSVLTQEFEDLELIIIDDASTDETPTIIDSFTDPRIRRYRNNRSLGLFATLNAGFGLAHAPLIKIWAHDDIMNPNCLCRFLDAATQNRTAGMWYSDFASINERGERTGRDMLFAAQRSRTPDLARPGISALLFFVFGCLPGNVSTVMLRRDTWAEVGQFLTGMQQAPDFEMWVRLSERFDIAFIREKCILLREHAQQLGRNGQKQLSTIQEELGVFKMLENRLQGVLSAEEFWSYFVQERGRQHVHWLMRAIIRGDISTAVRGWKAIRNYGHALRQLLFWLLSVNGKLGKNTSTTLFDAKRKCYLSA